MVRMKGKNAVQVLRPRKLFFFSVSALIRSLENETPNKNISVCAINPVAESTSL